MEPSPPPSAPRDGAIAEHGAPADPASRAEPREVWLDDLGELPARPRRRWMAPAPLSLLAVLLTACGFIAGVLVEKGQTGSSAGGTQGAAAFVSRLRAAAGAARGNSASGGPAGLPGLAAGGAGATGAGTSGAAATGTGTGTGTGGAGTTGALAGAAGGTRPTTGTVAYSSGRTLYVTDSEGNTLQVRTSPATAVTKNVKTNVRGIRPGETVTVVGRTGTNGSVTAETIRVGSSGGGLGLLFGGTSGAGAAGGGSTGSSSTGSSSTGSSSTGSSSTGGSSSGGSTSGGSAGGQPLFGG